MASAPVIAQGNNYWVEIHNMTGTTITRFHASPTWDNDWGPDLLTGPAYSIAPSGMVKFNLNRGCEQHFKVVYANGAVQTGEFDVCRVSHVDAMPKSLVVSH